MINRTTIIDRTEEEKNRDFEEAFAEGIGLSIKELREALQEIKDHEKRKIELEKEGMLVSIGHSVNMGKVLLGGSWKKLI